MTVLGIEEYRYGDSGILLNGDSNALPFVDVESIDGVDNAPFRSQTHDREGIDGGYVDAEFETIRTITIEGTIYTDPRNTEPFLDQLKANFAPSRMARPFYMQTDGGMRLAWGKSLGIRYAKDSNRRLGITPFQLQIICEDPRFYDPNPIIAGPVTLVAVVTSGRSYPKTYPLLYGEAASTSAANLLLSGNRETPGKIRITGPVINPGVVYNNTGTTFSFQTTLSNGDYLEIDLGNKSVLLNGIAPRRNTMTLIGTWYYLQPGLNSFSFMGIQSPPTPPATLSVTAYSAWR